MARTQFTFYKSFADALKRIRKKADRADAYDAICDYALFGIEPDLDKLSDAAAIAFELIRPNLDASRRRSDGGKKGKGDKQTAKMPQASGEDTAKIEQRYRKDAASKKEKEKEIEGEIEIEDEDECLKGAVAVTADPRLAAVVSAYMDKINPTPSQSSLDELKGFAEQMGADCCLRAFDVALDAKKANWPYIRGILRSKLQQGVRCLADWDAQEAKRESAKPTQRAGGNIFLDMMEDRHDTG